MMRSILACLLTCVAMAACSLDETSAGAGMSGDPLVSPSDERGVKAPFARACARLHGECSDVCDNLFVECYGDAATCTEQWTAEYLEDYRFPLVDESLLADCAAQVDRQACTELEPDSVACEFAIVESCPEDTDVYGANYSPFSAHPVQLGDELQVHLCDSVPEFFSLTLQGGTELEILEEGDRSSAYGELLRFSTNAAGDVISERSSLSDPVPVDGEYVLAIDASVRGDRRLTIATRTEDE